MLSIIDSSKTMKNDLRKKKDDERCADFLCKPGTSVYFFRRSKMIENNY